MLLKLIYQLCSNHHLISYDSLMNQTQICSYIILHAQICTYFYTSVKYKVNICTVSRGPA